MSSSFKAEEYYKKFIELQERLRKSEEERLKLEMKFNEMVRVTKEEEQMHYRKLRAQYKRFLEEDQRRQDRNERILRNLERIDSRIAMIVAKTERFKFLRQQYQTLFKRIYEMKKAETGRLPQVVVTDDPRKTQTSVDDRSDIVTTYLQNLSSNKLREMLKKDEETRTRLPVSVTDFTPKYSYTDARTFDDDNEFRPNCVNRIADDIINSLQSINRDSDKRKFHRSSEFNNNVPSATSAPDSVEPEHPKHENYEYLFTGATLTVQQTSGSEEREDKVSDETDADFSESDEILRKDGRESKRMVFKNPEVGRTKTVDETRNYNIDGESQKMNDSLLTIKTDSTKQETVTPHDSRVKCGGEDANRDNDAQNVKYQLTEQKINQNELSGEPKITEEPQRSEGNISGTINPEYPSHIEDKSSNLNLLNPSQQTDRIESEQQPQDMNVTPQDINEKIQSRPSSGSIKHEESKPTIILEKNQINPSENNSIIENHQEVDSDDRSSAEPKIDDQTNKNSHTSEPVNDGDQIAQLSQHHIVEPNRSYADDVSPVRQYDESDLNYSENKQFEDSSQLNPGQYEEQDLYAQHYDVSGQPVGYTHYDEHGQPIQPYDQQYDDQHQYLQDYGEHVQYDEHGRPIAQYNEQGQLIHAYDDQGQLYDENGQLIQHAYGANQQEYDENGQLIQHYDYSAYEQFPTQYDENGQVIQPTYDHQQYASHPSDENSNVVGSQQIVDESQPYDDNIGNSSGPQPIVETLPQEDIVGDQPENIIRNQANDKLEPKHDEVEDQKKSSHLMDMLDTDTESTKQDTKVSRDSDFDFSNN